MGGTFDSPPQRTVSIGSGRKRFTREFNILACGPPIARTHAVAAIHYCFGGHASLVKLAEEKEV
jgi:hypothetical protein